MKKTIFALVALSALCTQAQSGKQKNMKEQGNPKQKIVVYQVFTRLFGNKNTVNKPWGTIAENGVGKFSDFNDKALTEIRNLGANYIWYTGVPHHAVVNDYTKYGISNDDPDVVKGRAGSPYAVKDYYNVNPDLANNPAKRLEEFEDLVKRTHKNGLKVIIDIVPNHIARHYEGKNNPKGVKDFGADDNKEVEYDKNNDFYYIPGQAFQVPTSDSYKPLGGEQHAGLDGKFDENPAKWTGNGSRAAKPDINDWYETVKINYGIKPDGSKDFPELPHGYDKQDYKAHYEFWKKHEKEVPSSWKKFRDIALYWTAKGIDGFRYDMAEMVPVEFWSYMNSAIKTKNPNAFLLAEIYNPNEYRNYINFGKMDYLYDKVDLYDKLKDVIQGKSNTDGISDIQNRFRDIEHNLLHFLENHDEQRIASAEFAGNMHRGKPMAVLSTLISSSPMMIYFGQEVGEPGKEDAGFGKPSRTSIFDYIGVPNHQRWMNDGKFDGAKLSKEEKALRDFYQRLLNFSLQAPALLGEFRELQHANRANANYPQEVYSFLRFSDVQKLLVICNFSNSKSSFFDLKIPADVIKDMKLTDESYILKDQLYGKSTIKLTISKGEGHLQITVPPSESFVYQIGK
ncbi:alpha-amylase family glycosyl hydrolase [Flavobacterium sp.]|uniref:alpha-amylase family glycosyl hydrolase n=1 Tax=Flavobacterium sp. TaxID=239 RepID=UPI00122038AA|nr:alpha-amylase family glycosyl hydrolase [Flavobacterium sp.]RZJ69604.1 MAG: alpha-amylase [Flavobacterium sp.]